MNSNPEQYEQLTHHYRDLPDKDLLRLAAHPGDLTELAEEVLKKEIASRKLALADPPEPSASPAERSEENAAAWLEYAQDAPEHCTFWFQNLYEANEACALLGEAGTDSQILPGPPPLVVVRPEDLEQACHLLGRPVPDATPADPDLEASDFAPPACPTCQTPDPVLTAVDPTNRWLCESCEHEWNDPA